MENISSEDQETIREFLVESHENLSRLDQDLVALEKHPDDRDLLSSIFRTIHTIKGACGFLAFSILEAITHQAETLLSQLRDGKRELTPALVSLILETVDATRKVLAAIEVSGKEGEEHFEDLTERLRTAAQLPTGEGEAAVKATAAPPEPKEAPVTKKDPSKEEDVSKPSPSASAAVDANIRVGVTLLDKLMDLVGDLAAQLSSSWGFGINATTENIYREFIAQGQSLLQASGDSGAYKSTVMPPADDPNLTVVGGTSLTTAGAGGPWQSESAWSGSGGGVSTLYPIPAYQQGMSMSGNGGSATMRNLPDVALTADIQMFLIQNNGQAVVVGGTSAAAPLWAGFIALANQQATGNGKQRLGFLNPLIYAIGKSGSYSAGLNDIRSGSNNGFSAVSGYDLVTGWGSPAGQPLINDLTGMSGQPGFSMSTSASAFSVARGGTAAATVTISGASGLSSNVNLAIAGLPNGVSAAFSPASTKTTSTVTFNASSTAAAGSYPVTITGTSGAASQSATLSLTVTVPGFTLSLSPATLALPHGSTATATVFLAAQGGFNSAVAFSTVGLPSGVTATFGVTSAGGTPVTFNAAGTATPGTYSITVKGVAGALSSSAVLVVSVLAPPIGTNLVNLAPAYNINALVVDGVPFSGGGLDGGLNGSSTAYSSNLTGVQQTIGGTLFYFGPANAPDAVSGKTIALPAGQYSTINLLATGVNGNQPGQIFKVTFTDGTTSLFTQSLSDWFSPQFYTGESTALTMAYRDNGQGVRDNRTFYMYEYKFTLNANKTVASMTVPGNRNVVILAASLTGPKVAVHRALGVSR